MNSILQTEKRCWVCGYYHSLHLHHIFYGTAHRKISDKEGLVIWLCPRHHNMSNEGIHFDKELDLRVKMYAQTEWLRQNNNDMNKWFKLFRRSWL